MSDIHNFELPYDLADQMAEQELVEIHIGDVNLPTGKIIAADPFFASEQQPFARTVIPDKYPVYIYMAEIDKLHNRIAYAKIKFRPETSTRWVLALTDDMTQEELDDLGEDEFYGFPVESGIASFLDAETNEQFADKIEKQQETSPDGNFYDDVLAAEFMEYSGKNNFSRELGDWNDHQVNEDSDNNVIMFAAGWGDGYYPAYWGLNDEGDAVELVIDFLLDEFESTEDDEDESDEDTEE